MEEGIRFAVGNIAGGAWVVVSCFLLDAGKGTSAYLWFRHLMTGTGAYFYITWGIWLRHCLNGEQDEYDMHWPSLFSLPEVIRTRKSTTAVNGKVKALRYSE